MFKLTSKGIFKRMRHVDPNLGGLFRDRFWGGGGVGKITLCLKLVTVTLDTWNLVRK